jgi:hypothetical protein
MAKHVRRHMAKVQLSIAAGALGLLAGVGLGKGTPPAQVGAEPAAHNVITINGSNIRDGSVKFKDLDKGSFQKFVYLKANINKLFLKRQAAAGVFAKLEASDALIIKMINGLDSKLGEVDSRFVNGDGSVFTGSQLVNDTKETLLTVPNTLKVEASTTDGGKNATLTLTNLATVEFTFASTAPATQGNDTQHGNLAPGNSTAILIGLLQPATVQIIPGAGDGGGVHTFTFTAYGEAGGQVQVVGQALSR